MIQSDFMGTNPFKYDSSINALINDLNGIRNFKEANSKLKSLMEKVMLIANPDGFKKEIANLKNIPEDIKNTWKLWDDTKIKSKTPEFINDAIKQVKNPEQQKYLREKLGLLKEGDIVCEKSQGNLLTDAKKGENACACICLAAVKKFLSKDIPTTEEEMYALIREGIKTYEDNEFHNKVVFDEILAKDQKLLKTGDVVIPDAYEKTVGKEMLEMMKSDPISYPLPGKVEEGDFKKFLLMLNDIAANSKQRASGVITCNGETIALGFLEPNKPLLFDSHGTKYRGVDQGATLRKFDSIENLEKYLSEKFKNKGDFVISMIKGREIKIPTLMLNLGLSILRSTKYSFKDYETILKEAMPSITRYEIELITEELKNLKPEQREEIGKDNGGWFSENGGFKK